MKSIKDITAEIQERLASGERPPRKDGEPWCEEYQRPCHVVRGLIRGLTDTTADCDCLRRDRAAGLAEAWSIRGLPASRLQTSINTWHRLPGWSDRHVEASAGILAACAGYARDPSCKPFLVLHGPSGAGKTHLAISVARLIQHSDTAFATMGALLDDKRRGMRGEQAQSAVGYYDALTVGLLVLDDLFTEVPSDWAAGMAFMLINGRLEERRPTIITTMMDPHGGNGPLSRRLRDSATCEVISLQALPDARSMDREV